MWPIPDMVATSSNSSSNSIVGKDTNRREDSLQYLQHLHQDLMELAEFIDRSEEREMLDDLLQRGPEHGHERQKERRKDQDTAWNDLIQATEMASAPSKPSKQQKKLRASERDKKMHDLMTRGPTLASWASLSDTSFARAPATNGGASKKARKKLEGLDGDVETKKKRRRRIVRSEITPVLGHTATRVLFLFLSFVFYFLRYHTILLVYYAFFDDQRNCTAA